VNPVLGFSIKWIKRKWLAGIRWNKHKQTNVFVSVV